MGAQSIKEFNGGEFYAFFILITLNINLLTLQNYHERKNFIKTVTFH